MDRLKQRKTRDCGNAAHNGGAHCQDTAMSDDARNGGSCLEPLTSATVLASIPLW